MSWYRTIKLSVYQPDLFPSEEMEQTRFSGDMDEDLEDASGLKKVMDTLDHYGIEYEYHTFPEADPILVYKSKVAEKGYFGRETFPIYVIGDFDWPHPVHAQEWIDNINSMYLTDYVSIPDKGDEFWEYPSFVYHATDSSNAESIMRDGLHQKNDSRGLSNRDMGSAVFTSLEPDAIEAYGDTVIAINAPQMKADGYMPSVEGETPLVDSEIRSAIANLIGFDEYIAEEYSSEGFHPDTLAFYGDIPPKYLEVME